MDEKYYNNICKQHTGVVQDVANIKYQQERQGEKLDNIISSNRSILGGVVVACIMLAINLLAEAL